MSYSSFPVMRNQSEQGQITMHYGCYIALQNMMNQVCAANQHLTAQAEYFRTQLRDTNYELQHTKQEFQQEKQELEEELDKERKTCEQSIQGLLSKETECTELQKEVAVLRQKLEETTTYWRYAEHVAKEAGNTLQAKLSQECGEAVAAHENLDIGEFLIECGRNTALLQMSKSGPDEQVMRYNNILEHNANHQRRIKELLKSNQELSQRLEARDADVANLTKALDMCTEDGSAKRRTRSSKNTVPSFIKTEESTEELA